MNDGAGHIYLWPYCEYDGRLTNDAVGGDPVAAGRAAIDADARTLDHPVYGPGIDDAESDQ